MIVRMMSFAYTPGREPAVDVDAAHFQRRHRQRLRREHVTHLRRADAERERTKRAMRRGMAVPAADRHSRLRQAELRTDDVHDALRAALQVEQPDAVTPAVLLERRRHALRHQVGKRPRLRPRRHDVVDGRERPFGGAHRPAARVQLVECLRAGHFVDQMQPDVELRLPIRQRSHRVLVPDFLKERSAHRFPSIVSGMEVA